jgi:hypothetical protein
VHIITPSNVIKGNISLRVYSRRIELLTPSNMFETKLSLLFVVCAPKKHAFCIEYWVNTLVLDAFEMILFTTCQSAKQFLI